MAAANVESVFSGAGKFTLEAKATGAVYLRQIVKVHYNWKYPCLQPTEKAIIARYMLKHGNISAPSAAPPSTCPRPTHRAPMLPLRLRHPRARPCPWTGPTSGHAADPPSADPLAVASTGRCSSAPVFSRTRHTLHE